MTVASHIMPKFIHSVSATESSTHVYKLCEERREKEASTLPVMSFLGFLPGITGIIHYSLMY